MTDDRETPTPTPAEDAHPLASPTELAGTTEGAIDAEFAARDLEEAMADAEGAAAGADLGEGKTD